MWCCKHAFSRVSDQTLAYCDSCKILMVGLEEEKERGGRGQRSRRRTDGDNRVGKVVMNCDKETCGRHMEADLQGSKVHAIDKSYLKETRKKKGTRVEKCGRTMLEIL